MLTALLLLLTACLAGIVVYYLWRKSIAGLQSQLGQAQAERDRLLAENQRLSAAFETKFRPALERLIAFRDGLGLIDLHADAAQRLAALADLMTRTDMWPKGSSHEMADALFDLSAMQVGLARGRLAVQRISLVQDRIVRLRNLLDQSTGSELEEVHIRSEVVRLAMTMTDAMLSVDYNGYVEDLHGIGIGMLTGRLSAREAAAKAQPVTSLPSQTPLWARALSAAIAPWWGKADRPLVEPEGPYIVGGYRFDPPTAADVPTS